MWWITNNVCVLLQCGSLYVCVELGHTLTVSMYVCDGLGKVRQCMYVVD